MIHHLPLLGVYPTGRFKDCTRGRSVQLLSLFADCSALCVNTRIEPGGHPVAPSVNTAPAPVCPRLMIFVLLFYLAVQPCGGGERDLGRQPVCQPQV